MCSSDLNQQGQLVANFGSLKPPSAAAGGLPGLYDGTTSSPVVGAGALRMPGADKNNVFLTPEGSVIIPPPGSATPFYNPNYPARPGFGPFSNPFQPGVTSYTPGVPPTVTTTIVDGREVRTETPGKPAELKYELPTSFQYPNNQFFDFVRATIESSSTKVLASPTLILSENGEELRKGDDVNALASLSAAAGAGGSGGKIGRAHV